MVLNGIVVVDTAGPSGQLCGRLLADAGATVLKVDAKGGDPSRYRQPIVQGADGPVGLPYLFWNSGKKLLEFDVTTSPGRTAFQNLVESAALWLTSDDSTTSGLLPEPEEFVADTPSVIISAFGRTGPYSTYKGNDIVFNAMGGLTNLSGDRGGAPCTPPEYQSYYSASYLAFTAALAALWSARSGSPARHIEIAIFEVIASFDQMIRTWGYDRVKLERSGSQHGRIAPASVFRTKDGYVHLFVSTKHWPVFLEVWENHPEEYNDKRLASNDARRAISSQLNRDVENFTMAYETGSFVALMEDAGIPCQPVNKLSDVLCDAHLKSRKVFHEQEYDSLRYIEPKSPVMLGLGDK